MKYLLLLLPFSFSLWATTLEQCSGIARNHGHPVANKPIPPECYELMAAQKNSFNFDVAADGLRAVLGHQNIVYILEYQLDANGTRQIKDLLPVAGTSSLLDEVLAIETNLEEERFYVLNKSHNGFSVLSYPMNKGGNIVPRRKLITDEIENASNIKIDHANKELYVLSSSQRWIKVFNLHADPHGRKMENSVELIRKLEGNNTHLFFPIDMAILENEIFVLESASILIYPREASEDASPVRIISGPNTALEGAKTIDIDAEKNILYIKNGNGEILRFDSKGDGNEAPLP